MQVCVFTDEVSRNFDEALSLAKAAGADSVEIRGGLYGGDLTTVDSAGVLKIREALQRYGMRVASIGSPCGKCRFDVPAETARNQEVFRRMIALGEALGCRLIRCFAFWNPLGGDPLKRAPLSAHLTQLTAFLSPLIRMAESAGFLFGLEMESDTMVATAAETVQLYHALGDSSAFRVVWDILNEWGAGETPYPDGYELLRGLISHVHIKPNRDGNMITVGSSSLTYGEILVALNNDGYTGAASIEHWGTTADMLRGVQQLRIAVNALG